MGWTHRSVLMVGALAGLVVGGCGGSSSPGDAGSGASSPTVSSVTTVAEVSTGAVGSTTVTDAATTTTTVADTAPESTAATTTIDPRPIDPEDEALAKAGTLTADAFAAPWTVHTEGKAAPVSTDSCSYRPDGAVTMLTNGAVQNGPTMQLGDTNAFLHSSSLAFPDETLAMEHVAILNSDVWATCYAAEIQKFQADNGFDKVVSVARRDDPSLNQGGFESFAEFDIASPEGVLERVILVSVFRYGREVIIETQEYGGLSDADSQKFFDDSYAALLAAYDRVVALP